MASNLNNQNQFHNEEYDVEQQAVERDEEDGGRKPLGMVKEHTMIEIVAGGLALISVCTSIAAMIVTSSFIINGAGVTAILLGPYSYWQQRNITDIKALEETHEALKKEVNHLRDENIRLKGLVTDLTGTVDKLESIEDTLDQIRDMNVESVEEFRQQVEEGRQILAMMRKNVKEAALQNVITVVLNSDTDGDYIFNHREVEKLIANLKAINGLEMNEAKFRQVISDNDGSVDAVVTILDDIVRGNSNANESIFKLTN